MRELTECNVCENQSNKDEGKEYSKMGLQAMLNAVSAGMGPPRLVEIGKIKVGGLGEKRVSARGTHPASINPSTIWPVRPSATA